MYAVVLLTASRCDANPDCSCIMDVFGPFEDRAAAVREAERWPAWTTPHIMQIQSPIGPA